MDAHGVERYNDQMDLNLNLDKDVKTNSALGLKLLNGQNLVIHCHHYNSRIQSTIEKFNGIDGKEIVREAAREVFYTMAQDLIAAHPEHDKTELCRALFSLLGFGTFERFSADAQKIVQPSSHYVEGWRCGTIRSEGCVCTVSEGYLSGFLQAITGKPTHVTETTCMNEGASSCVFEIGLNSEPTKRIQYIGEACSTAELELNKEQASNIDRNLIIETVSKMPLWGDENGLIPAFGVYLANTPQDFYNLICFNFVRAASEIGMGEEAEMLLVEDAEFCAINTFHGILHSEEWHALIKPMVKEKSDELFGLVAVANSLGWGRFMVHEHSPGKSMTIKALNSYEGCGYKELFGASESPACYMLNGVSSGLMGLLYTQGELEDRAGNYWTKEIACTSVGDPICEFRTEAAS